MTPIERPPLRLAYPKTDAARLIALTKVKRALIDAGWEADKADAAVAEVQQAANPIDWRTTLRRVTDGLVLGEKPRIRQRRAFRP